MPKTHYISTQSTPQRYHQHVCFPSYAHASYKLSIGFSTPRVRMQVNCTYMLLMYVIYRGLRLRDLDQEFSRRESWEYLLDRDTFESDGLEARGNVASSMTNNHFNLVGGHISRPSEPSQSNSRSESGAVLIRNSREDYRTVTPSSSVPSGSSPVSSHSGSGSGYDADVSTHSDIPPSRPPRPKRQQSLPTKLPSQTESSRSHPPPRRQQSLPTKLH